MSSSKNRVYVFTLHMHSNSCEAKQYVASINSSLGKARSALFSIYLKEKNKIRRKEIFPIVSLEFTASYPLSCAKKVITDISYSYKDQINNYFGVDVLYELIEYDKFYAPNKTVLNIH